jgi:N-formylmaleamate deformylase
MHRSTPWLIVALIGSSGCALAQDAGTPPPAPQPAAPEPAGPSPDAKPAPATLTPLAHVETRGTGPVQMILIPGLVTDWRIFEGFMTRNGDRYTMHAVTLPGFAGSDPPPDPGTPFSGGAWLENAERAVLKLMEDRSIEKPVIVGQSMGGHIALRLATGHPEKFRSAVVLNSMAAYPLLGPTETIEPKDRRLAADQALPKQIEGFSQEEWAKLQGEWFHEAMRDKTRAAEFAAANAGTPKAVSSRYMFEYFGADITEDLPKATLPVLVIAGIPDEKSDTPLIHEMWKAFYRPIASATVVFFQDTREFITEDAPAELDRAVEQFVKGEPVQGKDRAESPEPPAPEVPAAPAQPPPPPAETPKP